MVKIPELPFPGQETKPCIVIVDDDESMRAALGNLLSSVGFAFLSIASGDLFLANKRAREAECLILDLRMKGMSGLEVQQSLADEGSHLPIIFISAHDDEIAVARAMKAGAIAFLHKPFSQEALFECIDKALE